MNTKTPADKTGDDVADEMRLQLADEAFAKMEAALKEAGLTDARLSVEEQVAALATLAANQKNLLEQAEITIGFGNQAIQSIQECLDQAKLYDADKGVLASVSGAVELAAQRRDAPAGDDEQLLTLLGDARKGFERIAKFHTLQAAHIEANTFLTAIEAAVGG